MTPEKEVAREALSRAFHRIDEINEEAQKTSSMLSPKDKAEFLAAYRLGLMMRVVSTMVTDESAVYQISLSLIENLAQFEVEALNS